MKIEKMTLSEVRVKLRADGYAALVPRAAEIREAARKGCLLWTSRHLTTSDHSRIDELPEVQS